MPDLALPGPGESSAEKKAGSRLGSRSGSGTRLPAVDRLLAAPQLADLAAQFGLRVVKRAVQHVLSQHRAAVLAGGLIPSNEALIAQVQLHASQATESRLRPVFNLSGTVIHTNLGRALLSDEAIEAVVVAMRSFTALEYDIADGGRGDRDRIVEDLLCELTGAEAATVVNNNAAAVLLSLRALAARKEAVISRGELIEIGGAFRLPDIMKAAGCKLVEVGTTNRTHARDYEDACGPKTGLILKAHWSNYEITGFVAQVDDAALSKIAHARGIFYVVDLGAGALINLAPFGLPREPLPQDSLAAGADVVTFSGDKLLGGPQAGLIVGRRAAIETIRRDPLKRALRVSKLTMAALEATLRIYMSGHQLENRLPTLALLTRKRSDIRAVCERIKVSIERAVAPRFGVSVEECGSQIGSGSMPAERLDSAALVLRVQGRVSGRAVEQLQAGFRALAIPVVGRIFEGALWLDLRCLMPHDESAFVLNLESLSVE